MKDKMRKAFIDEMKTIKQEISNTKSEYRKRDLRKKLQVYDPLILAGCTP